MTSSDSAFQSFSCANVVWMSIKAFLREAGAILDKERLYETLAECEFCSGIRSQNASRHLDSRGAVQKSGTRSLRVFWQSKLATCESVCFAVVSVCGRTRAKRGNGAKRSDLAHGKLTDALVTEEQHPSPSWPPAQRFSVVLRAR